MQPVQDLTIDSTISRAPYNFVLEDANATEFATWVPKLVAAAEPAAATHRRRQRSAAARARRRSGHRPRHREPLRHHAGHRRQCALRRVRPAHRLDHLYPVEPVPRHPRTRSDAAEIADRAVLASICRHRRPRPTARCRCRRFSHVEQQTGPLVITHFGQFPATTISFNTAPGAFARRRGQRDRAGGSRDRPAGELHHRVPRHGGGVSVVAEQRGVSDHRRDRDDVYRARRALRELHPSDHDSLDAAVGRRRRAVVADAVRL